MDVQAMFLRIGSGRGEAQDRLLDGEAETVECCLEDSRLLNVWFLIMDTGNYWNRFVLH